MKRDIAVHNRAGLCCAADQETYDASSDAGLRDAGDHSCGGARNQRRKCASCNLYSAHANPLLTRSPCHAIKQSPWVLRACFVLGRPHVAKTSRYGMQDMHSTHRMCSACAQSSCRCRVRPRRPSSRSSPPPSQCPSPQCSPPPCRPRRLIPHPPPRQLRAPPLPQACSWAVVWL